MLTNIEALIALSQHGTMSAAAVALRVSQSAISKRIGMLENQLGKKLIMKEGRNVALSEQGEQFVQQASPLIAELKTLLVQQSSRHTEKITIGASEAILSSWGSTMLANIQQQMTQAEFEIHAHRTPTVIEKIQSGQYMVGICAGRISAKTELVVEALFDEPMYLVPSQLDFELLNKQRQTDLDLPVITIEERSNSWQSLKSQAQSLRLKPVRMVESSFAAAQLAIAGFGHALVPQGVARALKVDEQSINLGENGLTRPCSLVSRKSIYNREIIRSFYQHVFQGLPKI